MKIQICDKHSAKIGFGISSESKIVVIGTSGCGKSTLANSISKKLMIKDIELDSLFWKKNWQQSETEEFRNRIENCISNKSGYVIHGNYNKVRDLTWGKSNILIWLDYSRSIVMYRVIKRTFKRILTKEKLWNDNIETLRSSLFAKDSIILWSWKTYRLRRSQYKNLNTHNTYGIEKIIIVKKPGNIKYLLNSFT